MAQHSPIEWTQATWNPVVGCSKVSPGCKNCYAIRDVHRMAGNPNPKIRAANEGLTIIQGGEANWSGKVRLIRERLEIPLPSSFLSFSPKAWKPIIETPSGNQTSPRIYSPEWKAVMRKWARPAAYMGGRLEETA